MMRIFVKGYGALSYVKNMRQDTGKNISKNLRGMYSQKPLDHAKQSATDAFKTASKRASHKTAEATGDLTGNKIADKVAKVSKNSQQTNSEIDTDEKDKEIPKDIYIYIYIYIQEKDKKLLMKWDYHIIMEYQKIIYLLDNTPN